MALTDSDLIARVLANDDRHAFAELVRRHQSDVRSLLRRLTGGDAAHADDLAQETFLRAYRAISGFSGKARFSTWLFRIATNAYLSEIRKRTEELEDMPTTEVAPDGPLPDRTAMRYDLNRALALLRPEERAALALTYGQGLPHEEAAAILEWPLGTVKTHVNRGKARLRELLAPEGVPA
jgi:RNA polymerase sigma-70 factor (ECF subfamily)